MASLYTALEISILGTNSGESKGFSHMTCRPDRAIMKSGYTNWKHFAKHQLQCVCMCVWAQLFSHSALCDPMDCSQPGSSIYGIFQARKLERVAISYSRGSSQPRDQTHVPCIGRQILYLCATCEAPSTTILGVKDPDSSLNSATLI